MKLCVSLLSSARTERTEGSALDTGQKCRVSGAGPFPALSNKAWHELTDTILEREELDRERGGWQSGF